MRRRPELAGGVLEKKAPHRSPRVCGRRAGSFTLLEGLPLLPWQRAGQVIFGDVGTSTQPVPRELAGSSVDRQVAVVGL